MERGTVDKLEVSSYDICKNGKYKPETITVSIGGDGGGEDEFEIDAKDVHKYPIGATMERESGWKLVK